jgi:hypothetical protein
MFGSDFTQPQFMTDQSLLLDGIKSTILKRSIAVAATARACHEIAQEKRQMHDMCVLATAPAPALSAAVCPHWLVSSRRWDKLWPLLKKKIIRP